MDQGRDGVRHEEKGEDSIFWWRGSEPSPVPPLVANPDPPIKSTLRSVLGLITIIILKRVRVFSFKATNLQHVRLEMEKRKQNL